MATILELYLRDQVIRGALRNDAGRRAADLLNEPAGSAITLTDARSRSVHVETPPIKLGTVRVQRSLVLFVVPHDATPPGPRQLRAGFVEKRPRPAAVGVGPFFVSGTIHVGQYDPQAIEATAHETGGRTFVPLTGVRVTSQYNPRWVLDVAVALVNRTAISYSCTLPTP